MNQLTVKANKQPVKIWCRDDVDESVINEIFKFREYRSIEPVIEVARYPIIDVGAHSGVFTLYARAWNAGVKIYAIEPELQNLVMLEKNLTLNKVANVEMIPAALSGQSGTRELYLTPDNQNYSLVEPEEYLEKTPVQTYSFKDFCAMHKLARISLVKLDIEGGEHELIAKMSAHDFSLVEYILLEYHTSALGDRHSLEIKLRQNGFSVSHFPSGFDGQFGFLLARNKRMK